MTLCPFCDYKTPEPDDGNRYVQAWQEVAHMQERHADIIDTRLREAGILDAEPGFGAAEQLDV